MEMAIAYFGWCSSRYNLSMKFKSSYSPLITWCQMIAVHYMKHKDDNEKELFYAVRKSLFAYGLSAVEGEEERPGPFTIKEYFQYISKKNPGEMLPVCF